MVVTVEDFTFTTTTMRSPLGSDRGLVRGFAFEYPRDKHVLLVAGFPAAAGRVLLERPDEEQRLAGAAAVASGCLRSGI